MPSVRKPLFAANWKMNKTAAELSPFVGDLFTELAGPGAGEVYQVLVAPPAVYLQALSVLARGKPMELAAQNCGTAASGAFTGELSPGMIRDVGANWALLGHSERRHVFGETDSLVEQRLKAALAGGLRVIFCVGETLEEREAAKTFAVLERQLQCLSGFDAAARARIVVAYEPVWAIGTGRNATPGQAQEVHSWIRRWAGNELRLLYGGSVKPDNAESLMAQADVDGFLVGGASLEAKPFAAIIRGGLAGKGLK